MKPRSKAVPRSQRKHDDVRMRGFAQRATVDQVITWIDEFTRPLSSESVALNQLSGRVLAADIQSQCDVPGFDRSMMDGFAVIATDIEGASTYSPLDLKIIGQSLPGKPFTGSLARGQAVRIMTGAPVPAGTTAVLPVEKTELHENGATLLVFEPVPERKHIGTRGEDIQVGDRVLRSGRRLRAQDVGVLSSIGLDQAPVVRQPRVRVVITGNELLPSGSQPVGCHIVDANGPMLAALVERDGGIVTNRQIVPDTPASILSAMQDDVDVVLISGGSSVGVEDYAPQLLQQHGNLFFHGVAMRPSSPSGIGTLAHRVVLLLPGNPVSCLCSYDFFAGRVIRRLAGRPADWPHRRCRLKLRRKLVSQVGRVDYARVRIIDDAADPIAVSGASILSSTTQADGFVIVPADHEGYPPETPVDVYQYE